MYIYNKIYALLFTDCILVFTSIYVHVSVSVCTLSDIGIYTYICTYVSPTHNNQTNYKTCIKSNKTKIKFLLHSSTKTFRSCDAQSWPLALKKSRATTTTAADNFNLALSLSPAAVSVSLSLSVSPCATRNV